MIEDSIHLLIFLFGTFGRIHTRDVDDRFLFWVEYLNYRIQIAAPIKVITNAEAFQIRVAIELLIIGVADASEPLFILRAEHGDAVAPKIAARHRDDVGAAIRHKPANYFAKTAVGISGCMMKFINRQEAISKRSRTNLVVGKTQCRVGADQHFP